MIRIRQVKIKIEESNNLLKKISKILNIKIDDIKDYKIIKKSIDARKKDELYFVYEVDISCNNEDKILKNNKSNDIMKAIKEQYLFKIEGKEKISKRPVIIGSGPAGLFCAYMLALNNYNPIVIERGEKVEDRIKTIDEFWKTGKLNTNSNVQFGEGGAGTFSDGKLNTLTKDKEFRIKKIFEIFVENGAPEEILYEKNPHIGTDILRKVIINMRNKIISMGGEFHYNQIFNDFDIKNNKITNIKLNDNKVLDCDILVLAIGHSARDTFKMLYEKKVEMQPKPFAIGVRISHPQDMINDNQYGKKYKDLLPPANYKLTYTTKENRGVYSFCMCPGGYVVNASSEQNRLAINGMSNYKRETSNANSALVVTVSPDDYGHNPLDGIEFQRNLEEITYKNCNGKIPTQLYKDFKNNVKTTALGEVAVVAKGDYQFSNLNDILPSFVSSSLKDAIEHFDKKIKGFARDDAILMAIESRTSSPIKIPRNEFGVCNIDGIYPCGEGAGYSGGITTSAMDGIKIAELIAKKYLP